MFSKTLRRAAAASLLVSTSSIALSHAQTATETTEDAEDRLSTVFVTGVGPQRETDEMIGNASAVTRDELVDTLSASLGNSLDREPGVSTTHFGQAASRPVLRGLGAERVLVLTNGIGVIDASAASPDHQVTGDGIDAEKIEILRGPAALAYGGQAIGGVVNVIDGLIVEDLPDRTVSGEAYGALNSVNDGEEGGVKAKFAAGPFVLSLSASARDFGDYDIPGFAESDALRASEGHEHEEEEHDEDEEHEEEDHEHEEVRDTLENSFVETNTYGAGLSWVGDGAFLGVAVRQQESTYGLPGHEHAHEHEGEEGEEEEEEDHEEGEEEMPFIDLEQTRIDIRGGVDLDDGPFTRVAINASTSDYKHTEFEAPGEPGTIYESDGTEGRVELGTAFAGFEGAVGVQGLDKTLDAFGEEAFITKTDTKSYGVFAYQTREWDGGFGIEGGLRYDATELDNVNAGTREFDLFSGSFGIHQHWESGLFLGSQVSWTERAPNESELFAFGAHLATSQFEVGDDTLEKERGLNFEATARWRGDSGFGVGANLFYTEFDGFIYLAPGTALIDGVVTDEGDGFPVFTFVQQDASFTGGEIYTDYTVDDGLLGAAWRIEASYDFVSGELDGGGNLPLIPPETINLSVDADWGLWEAGPIVSLAGDQDDPGAGELSTDGYATLDLRTALDVSELGFGQPGTELFLQARNVTDEEVRYATSVLKDTVPAPGRNIRGGVRLVF